MFELQKRAARTILYTNYKDRSIDLFRKLNWIPFYDEVEIMKCSIIYNRVNGNTSDYISNMFSRNIDIHSRVIRHGHINIVCPRHKCENEGGKSSTVSGIKTWNNLSIELRKNPSLPSFNKSLKKTFLEKYTSADHF